MAEKHDINASLATFEALYYGALTEDLLAEYI